jgi:hypothetical protein
LEEPTDSANQKTILPLMNRKKGCNSRIGRLQAGYNWTFKGFSGINIHRYVKCPVMDLTTSVLDSHFECVTPPPPKKNLQLRKLNCGESSRQMCSSGPFLKVEAGQVDKLKGALTPKALALLEKGRHLTLQTLAACQFKRLDNKHVRAPCLTFP